MLGVLQGCSEMARASAAAFLECTTYQTDKE